MKSCKDCKKRTITCHTTCEEYKEYSKYMAERRKYIHEQTEINAVDTHGIRSRAHRL